MSSIGCLWNSAVNSRSQLLPTVGVSSTVHFPLTVQLLPAYIRLCAFSGLQTGNFWKSLNTISHLLVTFFFSFIAPSVLNSLPASLWDLPTLFQSLTSKPNSKLSFFNRHFHKSRQAMVCVCVCVCLCLCLCMCMCVCTLCLYLCVYLREWCVLVHWVFLMERFVLHKNHPLLLLLMFCTFWTNTVLLCCVVIFQFDVCMHALHNFVLSSICKRQMLYSPTSDNCKGVWGVGGTTGTWFWTHKLLVNLSIQGPVS